MRTGKSRGKWLGLLAIPALIAANLLAVPSALAVPAPVNSTAHLAAVAVDTSQYCRADGKHAGMWLWNWTDNSSVITFALNHGVTDLFAYAIPGFSQTGEKVRLTDLSTRAKANGIRIWAMGGDPSWVSNPSAGVAWEREAKSSGLFNGFHLEIEPHQLPAWTTDQTTVERQYINLLTSMKQNAGKQTVELSLPWWYYTLTLNGRTLDKVAMDQVDQVNIITYADNAAQISDEARIEASYATSKGMPVRFASETNQIDPSWVSFYGDTSSHMCQTQAQVASAYLTNPKYLGFSTEEYLGWAALAP